MALLITSKEDLVNIMKTKVFPLKNKGPWELIYCEVYKSYEDAKERENRLKYYGRALAQLKRRIKRSLNG